MAEKKYSAESLQVLSGLEPVRRRPGMYTDTTRPNHMVQEVVDNSVDEAIAGYAREIEVTLKKDGSIEVIDDGRGMPVDIHPQHKVSGVELILTRLHAGAKFDNENYNFSGGLHGVGVSVVNALSEWLEVEVKREGEIHTQRYEKGKPKGNKGTPKGGGKSWGHPKGQGAQKGAPKGAPKGAIVGGWKCPACNADNYPDRPECFRYSIGYWNRFNEYRQFWIMRR